MDSDDGRAWGCVGGWREDEGDLRMSNDGNGTNSSGFSGLPAGLRNGGVALVQETWEYCLFLEFDGGWPQ